ncbi:TetR-like C-terminal domain-containing protein, partial [Clostridium perfringens]|uniref:TetR-like C-terminal domain-containing protein n=1 Tax=Clostridium perfringens TaxID=1502 RepID=UPI002ACBEE3B
LVRGSKVDAIFLDYFIKYAVGGVVSVIQTWLENDLNESPQEIVRIINHIIAFHP